MKLTLAYSPVACSLVPYILLTETGAKFDTLPINMSKGQNNDADYLTINPEGKVPTLLIDGEPLTENVAIQLWIAKQFPDTRLMPVDGLQYFRAISFMAWCAAGIHPKLTQMGRPERYCYLPDSADSVRTLGLHSLLELYEIADKMLASREWFFDHFTCADAYFYWCFRRGADFTDDTSVFTNCAAHLKRMEQRASVQKLLAYEKKVLADFAAKA